MALHLFREKGNERTTVRDLTEVMGISAPSLYNSFGGKKELFDEAVAQYARAPSRVIPPALEERRARGVFRQDPRHRGPGIQRPRAPARCFVISDPVLREERESRRQAIRDRLCEAQRDGDLAADTDVDALSDYIDIVLRGMSSLARDGADTAALRAAADVALRAWPATPRRTTRR
jgi:AcrR family transcriptional regulator